MKRVELAIAQEFEGTVYGPGASVLVPDAFVVNVPSTGGSGGVSSSDLTAAISGEASARNTAISTAINTEASARDAAIDAAIAAIPPSSGGGAVPGDLPGPTRTPYWNAVGKHNVFSLLPGANGAGFGADTVTNDSLRAAPFVLAKDLVLARMIMRCFGAGGVYRFGIYNADQDTYEPTTLVYGGAEIVAAGAYQGYAGLSVALEAGKVYWAALITGGGAEPNLYTKNGSFDYQAARIVGTDHDDASSTSFGLGTYMPYQALPANYPVNVPGDVNPFGGITSRVGSKLPLIFAGTD